MNFVAKLYISHGLKLDVILFIHMTQFLFFYNLTVQSHTTIFHTIVGASIYDVHTKRGKLSEQSGCLWTGRRGVSRKWTFIKTINVVKIS